MAERYTFEVRMVGKGFNSELIKPSEVAQLIVSIEEMVRAIVVRDNPSLDLDDDEVVIGLSSITQGSLINSFVTPFPVEVGKAVELTTTAITTQNFVSLPLVSVESLKYFQSFNRKTATSTLIGLKNGRFTAFAEITPETKIDIKTFIIRGTKTIYGTLLRIGGIKPPRAYMRFIDGTKFSCRIRNSTLAKQISPFLYSKIGVRGIAYWDARDMSLHDFRITELLPYQETPLREAFDNLAEIAGKYYESIPDLEGFMAGVRNGDDEENT